MVRAKGGESGITPAQILVELLHDVPEGPSWRPHRLLDNVPLSQKFLVFQAVILTVTFRCTSASENIARVEIC